jgi:hypothetical protein
MAVVELQFRERSFLDLIGSEALRPPLASRVLDEVRRRDGGHHAARLRVVSVEWGAPFLRARAPEPGAVLVKVSLAVDLSGPSVRWEGAPVGPAVASRCLSAEAWIEVSVARAGPCCRLAELRVLGPVATLPRAHVPLLIGDGPAADHGSVVVSEGVVTVRLATAPDDDVTGPVEDRLEGQDWARCAPGDLLAESVADALDDALFAATAWPDAEVRIERRPVVRWEGRGGSDGNPVPESAGSPGSAGSAGSGPDGPSVSATARLVAVGALPFAFDLPFTLTASTRFTVATPAGRAVPPVLAATTVVGVEAADAGALAAFDPLELLGDELRTGFDGRLDSTPAGATAVDDGRGGLSIRTRRILVVPSTRAWVGIVAAAEVGDEGLAVRGILAPRPQGEIDLRDRRGLEWAGRHRPRPSPGTGRSDGTLTAP